MHKSPLLFSVLLANLIAFSALTVMAEEAKKEEIEIKKEEIKKEETKMEDTKDAVAVVNGEVITTTEYDDLVKTFSSAPLGVNAAPDQQTVINELVTRKLVLQDAIKQGLDKDSLFVKQLEMMRNNALHAFAMQKYLETHPATEDRLKEEYSKFKPLTQYKARHIMVNSQQEAMNLLGQLSQGGNFVQLAMQFSMDSTSKPNGGDLGWFTKEQMAMINPEFAEAVANLQKGLAPQPVQSKLGWHVILLEEIRELPPVPFEAAKPQLMMGVQQQQMMEYLKNLKESGKVEIKVENK